MDYTHEKDLFLTYINSKQFKEDFIHTAVFGGADTLVDQSKIKRSKKEKLELAAKRDDVTKIIYQLVRELRNLIFSLIPVPLPIPDSLKEQLGTKDQVDTLWDAHIAPFISNLTNSNYYGKRTNIKSPFSKQEKALEFEKEMLDKEVKKLEKEQEELSSEDERVEEKIKHEKKILNILKKNDLDNIIDDDDPINFEGGKKNICWTGYRRVRGTAPYSKHSCVKN
jgi:hypothetical protein